MELNNQNYTDESIVAGIRAGGTKRDWALRCLFLDTKLRGYIMGFVKNYGGNEPDGEDTFQDAIIILERQVREGTFNGTGSIGGYLQGIARRIWLRKHSRNNKIESLSPNQDSGIEEAPDVQFIEEEKSKAIEEILNRIGEKCKQILTMYKLKHTMEEIAAALSFASRDVAKNEAYQCRQRFRNFVKERPDYMELLGVA